MLPDNLPHKCDIYVSRYVPDEVGADYDDPEAFAADVECWVQPASDREITIFQRRDQVVTHSVFFRGNPGIRPGYIIEPKDGRIACRFTGATLEVRSVNEATAGLGVLWKAMVEEIQPR